jgi:hypothetical protein
MPNLNPETTPRIDYAAARVRLEAVTNAPDVLEGFDRTLPAGRRGRGWPCVIERQTSYRGRASRFPLLGWPYQRP